MSSGKGYLVQPTHYTHPLTFSPAMGYGYTGRVATHVHGAYEDSWLIRLDLEAGYARWIPDHPN